MRRLARLTRATEQSTLRAARESQAAVIAMVDRLARDDKTRRPRPLGRVWRVQLDLAGTAFGEPTRLVDAAYAHAQQLAALHREFAHRLFEAMDTREVSAPAPEFSGNVVPLARRSGS